ncbi:alkaline phosphatase [Chitinophaga sancti]|uniref:alkaline phosphatase n=1 Tax=Chitinophaga sancti TaxID=1004 RepID=UPI002A75197B|nr:alkaline phosphatase [Chitinophaga sancti]WPQ62678.1 alkaline phosphatase [Chitinophaga sancti]
MKRREFFKNSSLSFLGGVFLPGSLQRSGNEGPLAYSYGKQAKNIIFMVSDGMSIGTLNMASLLSMRKFGRQCNWIKLYEQQKVVRALMDTASASSLITDSSAASSAWGGGVRVKNGVLNVSENGIHHQTILNKFKAAGKAVGCVTTVPITHATPAGFCISNSSRGDQAEIALQYLPLKFDIMMGGGLEFFSAEKRKDGRDVLSDFRSNGYKVLRNRTEMINLKEPTGTPVLGVFTENGLPFSLDLEQDKELQSSVPTLAEMTKQAIHHLDKNRNGFILQVEGGKVDWAAHANDAGALIYDQLAFDDAIGIAIAFAEKNNDTLVIITTDHGNSNPGLFYGDAANENFDKLQHFKYTNEWILSGVTNSFTPARLIERIEGAQGIVLSKEDAADLLTHFKDIDAPGLYNPRKLPFKQLAGLQSAHTSIGWGAMDHSADYVELAMFGPGSKSLKPFVRNTDLHQLMLHAAGLAG